MTPSFPFWQCIHRLQDLTSVGTAARVLKISRVRKNSSLSVSLLLEGLCRFRLQEPDCVLPFESVPVRQLDHFPGELAEDAWQDDRQLVAAVDEFREGALQLVRLVRSRVPIVARIKSIVETSPPDLLCDIMVGAMDATVAEQIALLQTVDLLPRYEAANAVLQRQLLLLRTSARIGSLQEGQEAKKRKKEVLLGKLRRLEGGLEGSPAAESDGEAEDELSADYLETRVRQAAMTPEATKQCKREVKKIRKMEASNNFGPEHHKVRCPPQKTKTKTKSV